MVRIDGAVLVTKPAKRDDKPVKCGFCGTGSCEQCPGATRGMQRPVAKIWPCSCTVCKGGEKLRCLDCKNATPGEVNPDSWACYDRDACTASRTARMKANPAYQIIDEIEEHKMARVAAKTAEKAPRAAAAPKTGTCLVTGEPTKGGLFKPGMDARYVSQRVQEVMDREVGVVAQRKRIKADGVSEALQAKFEKQLGIAQEKAAKAKEEVKAAPVKAAAKKAAPAKKETAAQRKRREAAEAAAAEAEAEDDEDDNDEGDEGDF